MALEPEHGSELVLEIESDLYAPSDPGWLKQVEALSDQLEREGVGVKRPRAPKPGEKGVAADLLLDVVSSGGGQIAATAILAWVAGYRDRRVRIRRAGGEGREVTVECATLDEATRRQLAVELERLAGAEAHGD